MLSANVEAVLSRGKALTSETQRFSAELDVFIKNTTQGLAKLRSDEGQYQAKELENLTGITGRINDQIRPVLALIKAAGHVGPYRILEAPILQLNFELRPQCLRPSGIATPAPTRFGAPSNATRTSRSRR